MTDSDKQALLNGSATIQTTIEVVGENTILTETNSIIDWNHEDFRQVKEEGWIGQFVARQVTGNLHNLSDDFSITDKELELNLGVKVNDNTTWYSLGNFLVTKVTDDEVNDKTSFEALDYTKKFNKLYVNRITYPCTAGDLAQDVCDQCGVELGSTVFKNSDYIIDGNVFTNNESCRDVMKAIGKLAFSWVRVDWDNKVYIDFDPTPFKGNTTPSEYNTFGNNKYYNLKTQKEVFGPVDKVVIGYSAIEGERTFIGDENGTCVINVFDNPLVFNQELRASIIESARDLLGITYTPLNTLTVGHAWLKGNELVRVVDMEGISHDTIPFDRTIQYFGHIKTIINSTTETKTNDSLSYKPEMVKNYERSEIYNDQLNKQIGIIIEEQSNTNSRLNTTINTLDGTIQRVSKTETSITDITTTTQVSTGKNSLYLEESMETNALSYNVDGATEQEEPSPSPSYPQEIKTIPSIRNLLDISTNNHTETSNAGDISESIIMFTNNGFTRDLSMYPNAQNGVGDWFKIENLKIGKTYTLTWKTNGEFANIRLFSSNQSTTIGNYTPILGGSGFFTATETTLYFRTWTYKGKIGVLNHIMLEEGSTSHEYVPYGFWSKIKITGKNLLDYNKSVNGAISENSTSELLDNNANAITSSWILCKPNTTYIISGANNRKRWQSKSVDGTITFIADDTDLITTNETARYLRCYYYYSSSIITPDTIQDVQIEELQEEQTESTTYEPYKEKEILIDLTIEGTNPKVYYELCKIGDYKDTLSIDASGNCIINKNIGKTVLNGNEGSWYANFNNCQLTFTKNMNFANIDQCFSNYFKSVPYGSSAELGIGIRQSNNASYLRIVKGITEFQTINNFKTWLSTHNIVLYYPLATSETIILSNTKIPLFDGINHVTFVDNLDTNTTITYYRNTPLSGTYATVSQLNDVSTEKTQEIQNIRQEILLDINDESLRINAINETIEQTGVPIVKTETGYTFDIDGLKIEKSDTDVSTIVDNDGFATSYQGNEILTVRSNGVESENMTVRKFYVQKPIRMEKTKSISDGSSVGLGFFYVGE